MQFADKRFFNYQNTEPRLNLLSFQGAPIVTNQRSYFGENSTLYNKRVVGIEIVSDNNLAAYNTTTLITPAGLSFFTVTFVDEEGKEVIKDYPIKDLHSSETFGNIRVFNRRIDLEKSYVVFNVVGGVIAANSGILFNFLTVSE